MATKTTNEFLGTGRRKTAVARVRLATGSGKITVNRRAFENYFPLETLRATVVQPLTVAGALDVEKCFARKTGLRYHVDLHLEVDPDLTVRDSHSIAEQVRNKVKADLPWVADVLVHVEPHPPGLRQNCAE